MDLEKFYFVAVHIVLSAVLLSDKIHGQTIASSCKELSSSNIPKFCEEVLHLDSNTLYQDNLGDPAILENISSLEIQSPCLSRTKRYFCYLYYPVCSNESGDVVPLCSNSCELLKSDDPVCSELIFNVSSELKEIGLEFPKIECLKDNEEIITPCFDLDNGSIITPVTTPPFHIECIPIPVENACFSQLSHTYFTPNIFDNVEEFQKEFRTITLELPTTNLCRGFFSSLSCLLAFPSCNSLTNKVQPICEHLCPTIDMLVYDCMSLVNFSAVPMLTLLFEQYNCTNASSYFIVPPEYIDTESCNAFIMSGPSTETSNVSSTMSSSRFPLGLSESGFIIAVVCTSAGVLLSCITFSVCVAVAIYVKKKQKKKTLTIRDTMQNSVEVGIPSQYVQYLSQPEYVNKDVTSNDGVYRLLKEVETQFADCLISPTSISKNKIIGKGEFGVVYRGHLINDENNSTQTIAIKTVRSLERWLSEAGDFMSESTIMAYFDHPNVLRMIGLSVDTDIFSIDIVLPYMINGDLRAFLKGQRVEQGNISSYPEGLNEVALITMCMDIAKGMEYLASKRFVHRDLAARNCMVDENICVKVADFGLAKDIYSTEYYRMNSNTRVPVKWMSPESLLDGFFNEKTDVWSYGVTCWEIFSLGRLPYAGIENHQILRTLKNGYRLEKPDLCSDELYNSVIASCWEETPTNRLAFRSIVQTLDHILADADIHT